MLKYQVSVICVYIEGIEVDLKYILRELHIKVCPGSEKDLFKFTFNFLYHRYDFKQIMKSLENPKNSILLIRLSWLIVSNAFWRSMSIIPVWRPDSKPVSILLFRYKKHEPV